MLAALYFVPSASATPHHAAASTAVGTSAHAGAPASHATPRLDLADTGAVDTKPYLIGGSAFLVVGAGLVLNAGRRSRAAL